MWCKLDRSSGRFLDRLSPAKPRVYLLYENEADRQEMLSRIQKAGLGELPRVMISLDSLPARFD